MFGTESFVCDITKCDITKCDITKCLQSFESIVPLTITYDKKVF